MCRVFRIWQEFEQAKLDVLLWLFMTIDTDSDETLSANELRYALDHDQSLLKGLWPRLAMARRSRCGFALCTSGRAP